MGSRVWGLGSGGWVYFLLSQFCLMLGVGSQKPEAGSRKPEAGSQKPEAGSQKPEAGSQKPEAGSRKPEAGSRKPEAGSRFSSWPGGLAHMLLPLSHPDVVWSGYVKFKI